MTPTLILAVALAGACGASCRWLVDGAVTRWMDSLGGSGRVKAGYRPPWGTLAVNISGSFALGVLVGLVLSRDVPEVAATAIGVGFLGAYTTFSTWMYQSVLLIERRAWRAVALDVAVPLLAGPVAALVGMTIVSML